MYLPCRVHVHYKNPLVHVRKETRRGGEEVTGGMRQETQRGRVSDRRSETTARGAGKKRRREIK